jgi:HAMP domain-containing protein
MAKATARVAPATATEAAHLEHVPGQPPIEALLAAAAKDESGLNKSMLLHVLIAFKKGDFSVRLPNDLEGIDGKIADAFNDVIELNERMANELERLSRVVGKEGKISQRASIGGEVTGAWKDSANSVNQLISDLVYPISETSRVIGAVAKGDLSQAMSQEIEGRPLSGEFLRTAKTVNTMVEQLGSFAAEVTRVAREVGTEGKLGGQAKVKGVAGTWKDLDGLRELHGREPDRPGAKHRRRDDRGGERRLVQEDYGGRERGNSGAEADHQHHGGPAPIVRLGSDARGARSGYRRKTWRPGRREGRRRYVEGLDRQREPDGR